MSFIDRLKIMTNNKEAKLQKGVNAVQNIYAESESKKEATQNAVNKVMEEIQAHPDMPVGEFLKMLQERTDLSDDDLVKIVKQMPDVKSEEATIEAIKKLELPSEAITEIIQDAPVSPVTAKKIAEHIPDKDIQEKQQAEIEKMLEAEQRAKDLAREKEILSQLTKIYNTCELINDNELVEKIDSLEIDLRTQKIDDSLKHIIAKKIALDYMQFGGPKLPTMMRIMPAVDMLEENLPLLIEKEYQKVKTDYDEQGIKYYTYGKKEKQMVKTKLLENIAKKVANDFKEIGDINVPQTEQLRNLTTEEAKVFVDTVKTFCDEEQLGEYDVERIQSQLKGESSNELDKIIADIDAKIRKLPNGKKLSTARTILDVLEQQEKAMHMWESHKKSGKGR